MKQAAFAGKARSITGVTPLYLLKLKTIKYILGKLAKRKKELSRVVYKANGPSFRISSAKTSRIPFG